MINPDAAARLRSHDVVRAMIDGKLVDRAFSELNARHRGGTCPDPSCRSGDDVSVVIVALLVMQTCGTCGHAWRLGWLADLWSPTEGALKP